MNKERDIESQRVESIQGVLQNLAEPYVSIGETPPPFQVKQVARQAGLTPATVARIVNQVVMVGSNGSSLEASLKESDSADNKTLNEMALSRAPFKRAVQKSEYRSRAPKGGPVIKRRINEDNLAANLLNLGKGRLRITLKPFDEERVVEQKEAQRTERKRKLELRQSLKVGLPKRPDDSSQNQVQEYMERTLYWSGAEKQVITPDFLKINESLWEQIRTFSELQTRLIENVVRQYRNDLRVGANSDLVKLVEGNQMDSELVQTLREWTLAVPENELVNYYRPDLGIYTDDYGNMGIYSCELNIITAGTPPAILYREAQRDEMNNLGLDSPSRGALEFFWEEALSNPNRSVIIVGVSPLRPNQELYEKSHSDMANLLTELGTDSYYTRIEESNIREGDLIYWRIPPFQQQTLDELNSPQGRRLLQLYREGKVKIFPQPILPFMNNKVLEAIVWDDRFQNLVPEELKQFVPETRFIDGPIEVNNWQDYVIKRARGDGGVTIGLEAPKTEFLSKLKEAEENPGEYVIQRFISPARFSFRVPEENRKLVERKFFVRLEPTIAVGKRGIEIVDLFFTGRYDTRKVGGGKKAIMGTVVLEK